MRDVIWAYVGNRSSNVVWVGRPRGGEPLMLVKYKTRGVAPMEHHKSRTYGYVGVSRQRTVAAIHAESVGKYINRKIKPNHRLVEIDPAGGENATAKEILMEHEGT